jgi:hypothetical protein
MSSSPWKSAWKPQWALVTTWQETSNQWKLKLVFFVHISYKYIWYIKTVIMIISCIMISNSISVWKIRNANPVYCDHQHSQLLLFVFSEVQLRAQAMCVKLPAAVLWGMGETNDFSGINFWDPKNMENMGCTGFSDRFTRFIGSNWVQQWGGITAELSWDSTNQISDILETIDPNCFIAGEFLLNGRGCNPQSFRSI